MGNTQSQEGDPAAGWTQADREDQEFDLSMIPDDRESAERDTIPQVATDAQFEASLADSSNETPDMARRTDLPTSSNPTQTQRQNRSNQYGKRNKKRKRRSSNNTSNDATSELQIRKSPVVQKSPDALEDYRPLKDTEPETYHIYATSDESDVEDGQNQTKAPVINGFTAVNGASQKSPIRAQLVGTNDTESEEDDATPAHAHSPEPDTAVEALDIRAPVVVSQTAFAVSNAQSSTNIPDPRVNEQGRFLCPFADVYGCTITLVDKKGATRHAKLHLKNSDPNVGRVASARKISPQETIAAREATFTGTTEIPPPKVNGEGRFLCPFASTEGCDKTFAKRKSAVRHASIHTNEFVCFVCKRQMSRQDSLIKHMEQHSDSEIAFAANANGEATLEQIKDVSGPDEKPAEAEAEAEVEEAEEPEEGSSTDFATPQGMSPLQDEKQQSSVEKVLRGAQEVVDSEMVDVEPVEDAPESSSEPQSTATSSVFDEETTVKETPIPTAKLKKRKRAEEDNAKAISPSLEPTSKRKKVSLSSPPTSVPSNVVARPETPKGSSVTAAARRGQLTDKIIPQLQTRQGSMDGWAQKFTTGSGLKHPAFNPTPPRPAPQNIQVVIPRMSQGGQHGINSRKATYATFKGKERAEPGVEYSTPAKDAMTNGSDVSDGDSSEAEESSPTNIATSIAKRTFPRHEPEEQPAQGDDQDSDFDVTRAPESDDEADPAPRPAKSARPINRTRILDKSKKSELAEPANRAECVRCHRMFASEDQLRKHQKKPSAHVGLFKCHGCSEEFYATTALSKHEKDTGHGKGDGTRGRIGAFSEDEVNRLNRWRDQFCEYHNISQYDFNEMMTDTLERGKGSGWRWTFVQRGEFLKEYVNVLPNRNKRSMLRYRERNFQNVEGMKNWTADDDSELVRLQKELGSKWSEIARRLGRTVDAVSQRWRHKLQYGNVETGEWSRAECVKFRKILNELRGEEDGEGLQDRQIPWNKVSEKMGTRSAQQCSNHYRALHSKKHHGQWVKIDALEKKDGSSRILTPSKMELRLSGQQRRRISRKGLSEEFIRNDDGDDEEEPAEDEANEAKEAESAAEQPDSEAGNNDEDESGLSSEEEDASARSSRSRNPLPAKTPSKTLRSSQLFEQTQATTSTSKPSQSTRSTRKQNVQPSQDRPSPNIPIQRQRGGLRSPMEELQIFQNGEIEESDEDDAENPESSQELGTTPENSEEHEGSEAEGDDEADQKPASEDSASEDETATSDSSDGKSVDAKASASDNDEAINTESDEEQEEELVDREAEEDDEEEEVHDEDLADANGTAQHTDGEETQSADEGDGVPESPSTSPSPSQSESESDSESDDEDVRVLAEQPTSSFMASINESAKRANIKKVRSGSQTQTQPQSQALKGRPISTGRGREGLMRRDLWRQGSDEPTY